MKNKTKRYTCRNWVEYIKDNPRKYWFKRKLFGWGWVPVTWQGLFTVLFFIAIVVIEVIYLTLKASLYQELSSSDLILFFAILLISIAVLMGICYKKGEKPKWQWGFPKNG